MDDAGSGNGFEDDGSTFDDGTLDDGGDDFGSMDDFDDGLEDFDDGADDLDGDSEDMSESSGDGEGGKSFAELKDEYESGDAEWADELEKGDSLEDDLGDADELLDDDSDGDLADDDLFDEVIEENGLDETADSDGLAVGPKPNPESEPDPEPESEPEPNPELTPEPAAEPEPTTEPAVAETTTETAADGSDGKPYLTTMPEGLASELIVVEWLEYLVDQVGVRETARAIDYYERIDWVAEPVADDLQAYLRGFDGSDGESGLTIDHHTQSLRYISQLDGDAAEAVALSKMAGHRGGGSDGLQR
jgi:flagellar protein FlaE